MSEITLRDLETIHDAQEALKDELLKKETMKNIIIKTSAQVADELRKREQTEKLEKQRKVWLLKKEHAEKLMQVLKDSNTDLWINVWSGADKRVYVNNGEPFAKKTKEVAVLYLTGNSHNAPGSMIYNKLVNIVEVTALKELLIEIGNRWENTKINCQDAVKFEA